jgi:hypothetical protein
MICFSRNENRPAGKRYAIWDYSYGVLFPWYALYFNYPVVAVVIGDLVGCNLSLGVKNL